MRANSSMPLLPPSYVEDDAHSVRSHQSYVRRVIAIVAVVAAIRYSDRRGIAALLDSRELSSREPSIPSSNSEYLHAKPRIAERAHLQRSLALQEFIDPKSILHKSGDRTTTGTGKESILTSYYTYARDPQRKYLQSADSIEYIQNLYTTATHFRVPTVVFHDSLTHEFVDKYTNDYVTFEHVVPNVEFSTNDFRLFPYLDYIQQHGLKSVMMVDASDVFFNSNPFHYIREHTSPKDQLFMSTDFDHSFNSRSYRVGACYGPVAKEWPVGKYQMYSAGVWGGTGHAVECVLRCVADQLSGPLRGKGNCNMPAVNYCVTHGPCGDVAQVHQDQKFVNPGPRLECREGYPIIHNKCYETEYKTRVDIVDGEVVLNVDTEKISEAERAEQKMICRRKTRTGELQLPAGTRC